MEDITFLVRCSAPKTGVFVLLNNRNKFFDIFDRRHRFVTVPFKVCPSPVYFPNLLSFDVCCFGKRKVVVFFRIVPDWPNFEYFNTLVFDFKPKVEFITNVRGRTFPCYVLPNNFLYSFDLKFAE